jgi:single-strand DNA-binding protein
MSDVNVVVLEGNVVSDVQCRYIPNGSAVAEFRLAVNKKVRDKVTTVFVDVKVWRELAEKMAELGKKGSKFHVSGEIVTESWQDKNTQQTRSKTLVEGRSVQLVWAKQDSDNGYQANNHSPSAGRPDVRGEDIPF